MDRIPSATTRLAVTTIPSTRRVVERAARAAVPGLADFCVVHLVAGRGIRAVAGAHDTREGDRVLRALMQAHRIRAADRDSTVAQVVRSGRPLLRRTISIAADLKAPTGSVADLHRRLAPTSALVVPIVHDRAVLGALSLCYAHSRRAYGRRHLSAARRLASHLAAALMSRAPAPASFRLHDPARHLRQGTSIRRRLTARSQ